MSRIQTKLMSISFPFHRTFDKSDGKKCVSKLLSDKSEKIFVPKHDVNRCTPNEKLKSE